MCDGDRKRVCLHVCYMSWLPKNLMSKAETTSYIWYQYQCTISRTMIQITNPKCKISNNKDTLNVGYL